MFTIIPTWGYKPDGSAEIFQLAFGEGLPDGWYATPACISDPANATAEALSARAEGRPFDPPVFDSVSGFRLDSAERSAAEAADLAGALAEIQRLQGIIEIGTAENARLVSEIEEAEAELELAAKDIAALRASLASTTDDRVAASAQVEVLTGHLAEAAAEIERIRAEFAAATSKPAAKTK